MALLPKVANSHSDGCSVRKAHLLMVLAFTFCMGLMSGKVLAADGSDLATAMDPYSFLNERSLPPNHLSNGLKQIEMMGQQAIQQTPQGAQPQYSATSQTDLASQARYIAQRVRPALPIKSNRDLTLVRVDQSGGLLVYNHTVDTSVPPENYPILADWLRGQSYRSACSVSELVRFVNGGGALHYRFFINGSLINSTKIEGCR